MKANVFQLLDFDRVLFDTTRFITAITEEIDQQSPGYGQELGMKIKEAYKKEETFFLFRYLRETKGDDWVEHLVDQVVTRLGADAFILPGVRERLYFAESFTTARPTWGIVTYGDEIDQRMKLRIANLEAAPVLITTTPDKGTIIASWQRSDGTFQLPVEFGGQVVDTVTFEDDKLRAFRHMPENSLGIWVTKDEKANARIENAELPNVVVAPDLFASVEILKHR